MHTDLCAFGNAQLATSSWDANNYEKRGRTIDRDRPKTLYRVIQKILLPAEHVVWKIFLRNWIYRPRIRTVRFYDFVKRSCAVYPSLGLVGYVVCGLKSRVGSLLIDSRLGINELNIVFLIFSVEFQMSRFLLIYH